MGLLLGRDADAGVAHAELQQDRALLRPRRARRLAQLQHHLAALGELDGVADQVEQHLLQPHRVARQLGRQGRVDVVDQLDALVVGAAADQHADAAEDVLQAEGRVFEHQLAGLHPREVQHIVDQAQQRLRGQLDLVQVAALARGQRRLFQQPRQADDGVHRRADFVAHIGQEFALGAVGRLGAVARQHQFIVQFLQVQFGFLQFGDVGHQHEEAAHLAALVDVGDVVDPGVADVARRPAQPVGKALRLAVQRAPHVRRAERILFRAQHLGHARAQHLLGGAAVPFEEVAVGETAVQAGVPVGHHAGQVVGDGADEMLALGQLRHGGAQRFLGLLALGDVERDAQHVGGHAVLVAQRHLAGGQVARHAVGGDRFLGDLGDDAGLGGQHAAVGGGEEVGLGRRHEVVVALADQLFAARQAVQLGAVAVEHFVAQVGGALEEYHRRHVFHHRAHQLARLPQFRLHPFELGHVHQQAGDADDAAVGAELRIVADHPVAQLVRRGGRVAGALQAGQRAAAVEHGAVVGQHAAPHFGVGDHLGHVAAQVGDHRLAVQRRQVVVEADEAQLLVDIAEADRRGGVQGFQLGAVLFQLHGAVGHQLFQLGLVAAQVALQRAEGQADGVGLAEGHRPQRERAAAGQRLGRPDQVAHRAGDAAADPPGQRKAGQQHRRHGQRNGGDGGQQLAQRQVLRCGDGHRGAADRRAAETEIHRRAVGRLGAQQRLAAFAQLGPQRRCGRLAQQQARPAGLGHDHAVRVVQRHHLLLADFFVAQDVGQPFGLEQRGQRVGRAAVDKHRHVHRQQRAAFDIHHRQLRARLRVQRRQPVQIAGGVERVRQRRADVQQGLAAGVAEDELGRRELRPQQRAGLHPQRRQVAAAHAGRGGQRARGAVRLQQVAVDGGGHHAGRLLGVLHQRYALALVELADHGAEAYHRRQRARQHQQRDLRADGRQALAFRFWHVKNPGCGIRLAAR
ncbi:hypothetical protein DUGA2_64000 [Duganella sp. HH101]|nr:hypothetical protein DUGA2_64000 [Duganella sp. HH101]